MGLVKLGLGYKLTREISTDEKQERQARNQKFIRGKKYGRQVKHRLFSK